VSFVGVVVEPVPSTERSRLWACCFAVGDGTFATVAHVVERRGVGLHVLGPGLPATPVRAMLHAEADVAMLVADGVDVEAFEVASPRVGQDVELRAFRSEAAGWERCATTVVGLPRACGGSYRQHAVQLGCPAPSGFSGAPVVDTDGRAVAVVTHNPRRGRTRRGLAARLDVLELVHHNERELVA
jgi:Trypsin-like peptidase domain